MKYSLLFFLLLSNLPLFAQFAPPAGMPGTTAIPADSPLFLAWATDVEVERGWKNISNESLGLVETGQPAAALGAPDDPMIVSLGDGGMATLTFDYPIRNGEGFDFAVFENSFDGIFLELAFVEVSSDGENFVRFPATSNTQTDTPLGGFGWIDATLINNLAGKYQGLFGTPFDLAELVGTPNLNLEKITHVRIVDVVGSLNPDFATYDQNDHPINDPFPTPFESGGFDLDAVGVIHQNDSNDLETADNESFKVSAFPNPVKQGEDFFIKSNRNFDAKKEQFYLFNGLNQQLAIGVDNRRISTKNLTPGMYFLMGNIGGVAVFERVVVWF